MVKYGSGSTNLKGKGNKHQFEFCQYMNVKLDEVEENRTNNGLADAQLSFENGKNIIRKRMKLIKLADRD